MSTKRITRTEIILPLGGQDYKLRPLSLKRSKEVLSQVGDLDKLGNDVDVAEIPGLLDKLIDVCFVILDQSNAGLSRDIVEDLVSMEDILDILAVGMGGKLPDTTEVDE